VPQLTDPTSGQSKLTCGCLGSIAKSQEQSHRSVTLTESGQELRKINSKGGGLADRAPQRAFSQVIRDRRDIAIQMVS
jgi:hypothetical protein